MKEGRGGGQHTGANSFLHLHHQFLFAQVTPYRLGLILVRPRLASYIHSPKLWKVWTLLVKVLPMSTPLSYMHLGSWF